MLLFHYEQGARNRGFWPKPRGQMQQGLIESALLRTTDHNNLFISRPLCVDLNEDS